MKKKVLIILIASLAVIGAVVGVIVGVVVGGKGGNHSSDSESGSSGGGVTPPKTTFNAEDITLSIDADVEGLGFKKDEESSYYSVENAGYYPETMEDILKRGYFEAKIKLEVSLKNPDGKTQTRSFTVTASNELSTVRDNRMSAIVDKEVKFTMTELSDVNVQLELYLMYRKLGCDERSAARFLGLYDLYFGDEDSIDRGEDPGEYFPVTEKNENNFNFIKYVNGYKDGKLTLTPSQIVVVSEIEEGETIDLHWSSFSVTAYARTDYGVFSSLPDNAVSKLKDAISDNAFTGDLINRNHYYLNLTKENFDDDFDATDEGVLIDRNEIKFSAVVGYKKFYFTFDAGQSIVNFYGGYGSTIERVEAEKVKIKYDFEGTHSSQAATTKVKFLGQEATVPAKLESYDDQQYTVSPKDLPVFFADKFSDSAWIRNYVVDGSNNSTIPAEVIMPDSVTVTAEDSKAGDFGVEKFALNFIYPEYTTSTTLGYLKSKMQTMYQSTFMYGEYNKIYNAFLDLKSSSQTKLITYDNYETKYYFDKENVVKTKDEPFTYNGCTLTFNGKTYAFDLSFKIEAVYKGWDVVSEGDNYNEGFPESYYEGDEISIPDDLKIVKEYDDNVYTSSPGSFKEYKKVVLPFKAEYITGFSTDAPTSARGVHYKVTYNGEEKILTSCYVVYSNPVESITLSDGAFGGIYVKGESFYLNDEKITLTRQKGNTKTIPVTLDMVSGCDMSTAGSQTITVTYKEVTVTASIKVKQVTKIEFYENLPATYVMGELPTEVSIKVIFDNDAEDYDIYELTREQIAAAMDTSKVGKSVFSYTFGGVNISQNFNVVENIYFTYSLNLDGTAKVCGIMYTKPSDNYYYTAKTLTEAEIPSVITYDGTDYTVNEIAAGLFNGRGGIKTIILPDSISKIPDYAFAKCVDLQKLVIKADVDTVGKTILQKCDSVKELVIPSTLKQKLYLLFVSAPKEGKTVRIPKDLTVTFTEGSVAVPDGYFGSLDKDITIEKVSFPSTMTTLGNQNNGFDIVKKFESKEGGYISVKENVIYIDSGKTLYYYPKLKTEKSLVISDEVTKIGAIKGNTYLESVIIGANVTELSVEAFLDFTALSKVEFRGTLKVIHEGAFNGCKALASFTFPQGLEEIGKRAFYMCGLKSLRIPDTVKKVGEGAFDMSMLERIYIPASLDDSFNTSKEVRSLTLQKLTEIVYSGNIPLKQLSCYQVYSAMGGTIGVNKIVVTEKVCDNFATGQNKYGDYYIRYPSNGVYCLSKVTYVGSNAADADPNYKIKLYFEVKKTNAQITFMTNMTNQRDFEIKYGVSPSKWW